MLSKALNIDGGSLGAGGCASFADDKAPGDLIPKMQALNLLENKIICSTQHDFTDHCILSATNVIQREIKVKGRSFKIIYLSGAVVSHNGSKPTVLAWIAQALQLLQRGNQVGKIATYF